MPMIVRKFVCALVTTMPCCWTAVGRRGIACWTLFWTWTCATAGFVPCVNVTLMFAPPEEVDELEKYWRPSMPVSCCSSTWVTLFSTVSAAAPTYEAEMFTLGGATSGYCATGSTMIEATPASMITIVITLAKTGRFAKNLSSMVLVFRWRWSCRARARARARFRFFRRPPGPARPAPARPPADQLVSGLEAAHDKPEIADRAIRDEHARLDLTVGADDHRGRVALRIARHALLRREDRILRDRLVQLCAHVHARQQRLVGVRELRPQRHGAGRLVDGDLRELERAVVLVRRAIAEDELDRGRAGRQLAFAQRGTQPQPGLARLGEIDVDRIERADRRERGRLVRGDERTRGDRRLADPAGDRRLDRGVVEVDPRELEGCFLLRDARDRRRMREARVVGFLLRHALDLDEAREPVVADLRGLEPRLRVREVGLRACERGAILRRIDLVERLTRLDPRAFIVRARHAAAADLRPHFRCERRGRTPR